MLQQRQQQRLEQPAALGDRRQGEQEEQKEEEEELGPGHHRGCCDFPEEADQAPGYSALAPDR